MNAIAMPLYHTDKTGATVFLTQVVDGRHPAFCQPWAVDLLRSTLRRVQELHPFTMLAYVFLPDHLHLLIRTGVDVSFKSVMHSLKPNFTKAYQVRCGIARGMRFWQPDYFDHIIRDQDDCNRHVDYIHYNPVKHGCARRPEDWEHSSFRAWKQRGHYADQWGWFLPATIQDCEWE